MLYFRHQLSSPRGCYDVHAAACGEALCSFYRGPRGFLPGALAAIFDLPTPPAADLPTMPETPPTIAATSLLTTVLSCAKPYNGRKKAASSAAVTGKVRQPVRRDAH